MQDLFALFDWLPTSLKAVCIGGLAIFFLIGLFRLVRSVIEFITDLIPGW